MVNTMVILVPTLWQEGDLEHLDTNIVPEKQRTLLNATLSKGYRITLMNNFEYLGILFTQYVLEKIVYNVKLKKEDK